MPRRDKPVVCLEGCEVYEARSAAVRVVWTLDNGNEKFAWIPRSVCEDGDDLCEGDKSITVQHWFADKEDLPYDTDDAPGDWDLTDEIPF